MKKDIAFHTFCSDIMSNCQLPLKALNFMNGNNGISMLEDSEPFLAQMLGVNTENIGYSSGMLESYLPT